MNLVKNAFVMSAIGYCPLIWAFSNKTNINRVEKIVTSACRLVDNGSETNSFISAHRYHCEILLREIFMCKNELSPQYMHEVFEFKTPSHYSLRNEDTLVRHRVRTTRNGLLSLSHVGAQLWDTIPHEIRSSQTWQAGF